MNYILIVVVLLAAGIGVYYYIKNKQNQEVEETIEMDDKTYTLERMTAFVKQRLNEITKVKNVLAGISFLDKGYAANVVSTRLIAVPRTVYSNVFL